MSSPHFLEVLIRLPGSVDLVRLCPGVDVCHSSNSFFCTSFFHCSDQRNAFRNAVFGWRNGRGLHDGRWWFHERRWWWILLVFSFLFLLQENCYFVFSCPINKSIHIKLFKKWKKQFDTQRRSYHSFFTHSIFSVLKMKNNFIESRALCT